MKKILIIEDNPKEYKEICEGVKSSKHHVLIYEINLKELVDNLKNNNSVENIPNDIDLFIIDVSLKLGKEHNELGLQFLLEIQSKYKNKFDYIVTSYWDKADFQLITNIDESNFINKNNHKGFELVLKVKHQISILWEK